MIFLICFGAGTGCTETPVQPVPVVLDTDMSSDVDDVGALAVLHALADEGLAEIIAVTVSSGDPWGAPCIDAVNTYLQRPGIPIGVVTGKGVVHNSKYTEHIAREFQHDLHPSGSTEGAVALYRKVLASRKDRSLTIVTIGYLTNLQRLLLSGPDEHSDLSGIELVERKVKRWVCMGGQYPGGREWNFYQDSAAARYTVEHWPGPVTFVGFEAGRNILTGSKLRGTVEANPVRESYRLYNNLRDRPSWDQLAVLVAVLDGQGGLGLEWQSIPGKNRVLSDGSNRWVNRESGNHCYIRLASRPERFSDGIEKLMKSSLTKISN